MSHPVSNVLIECLPEPVRARFSAQLEPVALPSGMPISDIASAPEYVYFLTSGIASTLTTMQNGDAVEVGLVGREGFTGSYHLLGPKVGMTNVVIQLEGTGLRMPFGQFEEEVDRDRDLRRFAFRFVQTEAMILAQISGCNRLHSLEERLARWLLMVQDRLGQDRFFLTQEFVADMLGTRRSTVTIVAGSLQRAGLLEYHRGHVHILDRERLLDVSCECYKIVRGLNQSLYA